MYFVIHKPCAKLGSLSIITELLSIINMVRVKFRLNSFRVKLILYLKITFIDIISDTDVASFNRLIYRNDI